MSIINSIMSFLQSNLVILIVGFAGLFLLFYFLFPSHKDRLKPLSRSEIERKNFIKRNRLNKSYLYKWLYRGNRLLGKIIYFKNNIVIKNNPNQVMINELIVQPVLSERLKITNPFAKELCLQVNCEKCDLDIWHKDITIDENVIFNELVGIFYDIDLQEDLQKHIIDDSLLRTDFDSMASAYYVKAQEISTYIPTYAHDLAIREKDLEIELAKKKGKLTSI